MSGESANLHDDPLQFARTPPLPTRRLKTVIGVCLDESGSMESYRHQTIEAVNGFLASQKQETGVDECYLTLFKFNTIANRVSSLVPIQHVPDLTATTYHPGGSTALYDALAHTVAEIDTSGADADRIVIVVVTDGEENSSRETTKDQILDLIAAKEQTQRWTFVYLSASPQAFKDASNMGIGLGNTVQFGTATVAYATEQLAGSFTALRSTPLTASATMSGGAMGAVWIPGQPNVTSSTGTPTIVQPLPTVIVTPPATPAPPPQDSDDDTDD